MYIRVTSTPNSPRKSVKIVESIREGFKVKQKMIHHVGIASSEEEIEKLKQIGLEFIANEQLKRAKENNQLSLLDEITSEEYLEKLKEKHAKPKGRKALMRLEDLADNESVELKNLHEEQRIIEGLHEIVEHVFKQLAYDKGLVGKKDTELLRDIILMRIANPGSKFSAQRLLAKRFGRVHDLDAIYRMMDKLHPKIDEIKTKTFNRAAQLIPESIDVLFFDCTTLYFESTEVDELRRFGYSKDHRFNTTQVVLALATNRDGLPLGYELFEGNKAEVGTLVACLEKWKERFTLGQVCFVADRAMMSEANMHLLESHQYHYVIAAKLRGLPDVLKQEILSENNYQMTVLENAFAWTGEFSHKNRRLVVSYKNTRAKRDAKQREQIVDKIKKTLGAKGDTQKLITNQGVKKFTKTDDSQTVLDEQKINDDSLWDGLHGIITNIHDSTHEELLGRYGRLWKIEESFRLNKHTLSMCPIFHFKKERIEAHIAICYMAFAVLRHMEYITSLTQKITPQVLIEELMGVQASILYDVSTGKRYHMPSAFSHTASKIYRAFNLTKNRHIKRII